MKILETVYLCSGGKGSPTQLTPTEFWRRKHEVIPELDGVESQLRAEFTELSDFNEISDEKFIELL
ncbi:hypothetical protein LCGC14_2986560 [marine sediment metagenome]|uniref:Uncharacterized protein n=1 Tax=marine sediment metagenome TaxID=412755 RepID=A0A0F8ZCH6_9ZZZZ